MSFVLFGLNITLILVLLFYHATYLFLYKKISCLISTHRHTYLVQFDALGPAYCFFEHK